MLKKIKLLSFLNNFKVETNLHNINYRGATIIELLVVIVVLTIIISFSFVAYNRVLSKAEEDLNKVLVIQIENDYERYLLSCGLEHSDELFTSFMIENYNKYLGVFAYEEGRVVHKKIEPQEEDEVPYLSNYIWMFRST